MVGGVVPLFFWMNEEQLGFDPTIIMEDGQRLVVIRRNGRTERLVIDEAMKRAPCVAGRATTCWKAYLEGEPRIKFVIKGSWQYPEREEEGELLREATDQGVVNIARYYSHETVSVRGRIDEIRSNVRRGLNIMEATNYRPGRSEISPGMSAGSATGRGRSSTAGIKRSSGQTGAALPPSKRPCSASPTKADSSALSNRVHRRVILRDYGKPIYDASSRSALLAALEGCIDGTNHCSRQAFSTETSRSTTSCCHRQLSWQEDYKPQSPADKLLSHTRQCWVGFCDDNSISDPATGFKNYLQHETRFLGYLKRRDSCNEPKRAPPSRASKQALTRSTSSGSLSHTHLSAAYPHSVLRLISGRGGGVL